MNRVQSANRAPSPTPTVSSGTESDHRTDSHRSIPGETTNSDVPQIPKNDSRAIARIHFDELSSYLASYLARTHSQFPSPARQKVDKLTESQFQELSTDVYDELVRRRKNTLQNEVPFLPVRDVYHPKRNQARQKLATLPTSRLEDISSNVYYGLAKRYPEFKEQDGDSASTSDSATLLNSPHFPHSYIQLPLPRPGRLPTAYDKGSKHSHDSSANERVDILLSESPSSRHLSPMGEPQHSPQMLSLHPNITQRAGSTHQKWAVAIFRKTTRVFRDIFLGSKSRGVASKP